MQSKNCYIEFEFVKEEYFIDLKKVFELVKEAKRTGEAQSDQFWLKTFPEYSLKHFYFTDSDPKPFFPTSVKRESTWHFYSLTTLLQTDYEIDYVDCHKTSEMNARIEYLPISYPYGGISGLVKFIASFNCKPTLIEDGTGIYKIAFSDNGNLSITAFKNPQQKSSTPKHFNILTLLRKLWKKR